MLPLALWQSCIVCSDISHQRRTCETPFLAGCDMPSEHTLCKHATAHVVLHRALFKHRTADACASCLPPPTPPEALGDLPGKLTPKQQMCLLQGLVSAGNAVAGGVKHSAICIDAASDRAAATTKCGVKSGAVHVKHAALVSGCWVHDKMQVLTPDIWHLCFNLNRSETLS